MKHKERVQKIKGFTEKNKFFIVMMVIAIIFLCSDFFFSKENNDETAEISQTETDETENCTWRFYPVDAFILFIGGGFCTVMILKEKRKLKEELQ
ncbi:MAG TPA: hypothetical protein DIW26_01400 [Ruminococcus sp.]|nr:hypothetical protein [Ruminococcus sp.]